VPNGAMAGRPKSFTIGDKLSAKVRPRLFLPHVSSGEALSIDKAAVLHPTKVIKKRPPEDVSHCGLQTDSAVLVMPVFGDSFCETMYLHF
jgi:hypothetical protein